MVMTASQVAWLILFLPLAACVCITFFTLRWKKVSSALAIGALGLGFLLSLKLLAVSLADPAPIQNGVPWLTLDNLNVEIGILVDRLSILMLLIVTGVGSLIFIYSQAYMEEDESYSRYFACLSLFAFSMLGIVLSNNFTQIFIFWELVGVSSYSLIGFWFEKPSAADAGVKAFMVNRVGDFGFTIGILMVWVLSGVLGGSRTLNFLDLQTLVPQIASTQAVPQATLTLAGLLVFCGVLGKSAQFPLHVWLPDAMEGPTPVSALIHAATMVAAGIYLIARTFFLFSASPVTLEIVSYVGGFTAIFAASMALVQNDIKRVLAYSTLSQLGYMVMAMGLGTTGPGLYHLATHAFFKALLFLGAGSLIHALHTQDIWEMGGLLKKMPVTCWTFLIGSLALAGIYPLSGFWSKDEILLLAKEHDLVLYVLASITAGMTAFYMGRVCFVAILGKPRWHGHHEPHESPWVMTLPLVLLCLLSVTAGFIGLPHFLEPEAEHAGVDWTVGGISLLISFSGILISYFIYFKESLSPNVIAQKFHTLREVILRKYFMDDLYGWLVSKVQQGVADFCGFFERLVIMKWAVNGFAWTVRQSGSTLRLWQTGRVQTYALAFISGAILLIAMAMRLR